MKTKLLFTAFLISIFASAFAGDDGKIIFSKKPITATSPDNFSIETFEFADKIYCRAFFPKKISDYKIYSPINKSVNIIHVNIKIEGQKEPYFKSSTELNDNDATSFDFVLGEILKGNFDQGKMNNDYIRNINDLPPGKYNLIVEIYILKKDLFVKDGFKPNTISLGSITFNKTKDSQPIKSGKHFQDLEAGMSNPTLEAKALVAIKDFCKKKGWTLQKEKVIIRSKDWKIYRDSYTGAILHRKIFVYALIKDGNACKLETLGLLQAYQGSTGYNENFTDVSYWFKDKMIQDEEWEEACDCE